MDTCLSCQSRSATGTGVYLGPDDAVLAAARLAAQAEHAVHAVPGRGDPLGLLTPGLFAAAATSRRLTVKIICHDSLRGDTVGARALRLLAETGIHIATTPAPPPPVMVADHHHVLMTVPEHDEPGKWVLITGPEVAQYLVAAIEAFCTAGTPLHLVPPTDSNGTSSTDIALLRLLSTGITQQDAAKRLHMSERTVSRRVADLKQRLDATSALQAGLEAARRGLI